MYSGVLNQTGLGALADQNTYKQSIYEGFQRQQWVNIGQALQVRLSLLILAYPDELR